MSTNIENEITDVYAGKLYCSIFVTRAYMDGHQILVVSHGYGYMSHCPARYGGRLALPSKAHDAIF